MANKKFFSQYRNEQIEKILETSDNAPFVLYYDRNNKLYRFFRDKARRDAWIAAYESGEAMPPEIAAYEFTDPFIAPAPYTLSFKNYRNNIAVLDGEKGVNVEFEFQTVDGNNVIIEEYVDVSYTFNCNGVSQSASATYAPNSHVSFLADEFLKPGVNSISIVASGRQTGVSSSPLVLTYYVVSVGIESDFNISKPVSANLAGTVELNVPYRTWGGYAKVVEFYVDSQPVGSENIPAGSDTSQSQATTRTFTPKSELTLAPGKHTLQMRTKVSVNGTSFYSRTLFREFIVTGIEQTCVMISVDLPSGSLIDATTPLVLEAVQYEQFTLNWGYYTSIVSQHTASITWSLGGNNISTRDASIVDASNETTPDPIIFAPDVSGRFTLTATTPKVGGSLADYQMNVEKNAYIEEYTNGLVAKFSALGRSNDEPASQRNTWTYTDPRTGKRYTTTFYNTPFNAAAGWINGDCLQMQDGAYAVSTMAPLSDSPVVKGATIEFVFETYNVKDTDAPVIKVDNGNGVYIRIFGNRAEMRSLNGTIVKTEFNENVRLHMAFIINPYQGTSRPNLMFIQTNGVRERTNQYAGTQDSFTTTAGVTIGDSTGKAGLRLYAMKAYGRALDRNSSLDNYIIESGAISAEIVDNDIMTNGAIDIDKLKAKYDTIAIEGNIDLYFNSQLKDELQGCWVQRTNPQDPSVNFTIVNARVGHPGQSTLGYSKPQLRIKSNPKDESILYGPDGETVIDKGYMSLFTGQIPEKKARLNPNFVDSTCGNAGGFFSMVNDIYPNVQIGDKFVLRNAADAYAREIYPNVVGQPFPYRIQTSPAPTPIVVIWRHKGDTEWQFLSMFTLLDEKKSPRKFGQRSIYKKSLPDGTLDPFDLYDGLKGDRLWDNANCIQFEIINNLNPLSLFQSMDTWDNPGNDGHPMWEACFEQEYPDTDDQTPEEQTTTLNIFKDFAAWLCSCNGNQAKFNAEWKSHLDPWKCAAYWVLAMKHGMADSMVRNMELRTDGFDENGNRIWFPIWWDTDVQKGKRNDGQLAFPPRIDRQTPDPDIVDRYCFEGHDSTFWNCLEGNTEFMDYYVPEINTALTKAGLTPALIMDYYRKFTGYYSERVYNESIENKYIEPLFSAEAQQNYLSFNMGNGANHDLWWIYENYMYWDARLASGLFTTQFFKWRAGGTPAGARFYFKAHKDSYFAYGLSDSTQIAEKQVYVQADNQWHSFAIREAMGASNPFSLYGAMNVSEMDAHEFALYYTAEIALDGAYDKVLGSVLKKAILGVSKSVMRASASNRNNAPGVTINALALMTSLEYLDIQGLQGIKSLPVGDLEALTALKYFYAAGSGLTSFTCADGARLTEVELPDSVLAIKMTEASWGSLKFFDSDINDMSGTSTPIPVTLRSVTFTNMGTNANARNFVLTWLREIEAANAGYSTRTLALSNIMWDQFEYSDLLLIAKIPQAQRPITGTIILKEEMTSDRVSEIKSKFGDDIFTHGSGLIISGPATFILNGPTSILSGGSGQYSGYSFPLEDGAVNVIYRLVDRTTMQPLVADTSGAETLYKVNNVTLNAKTGLLTTVESPYGTHIVRVQGVNAATGASNYLDVTITARKYGTSGRVSGNALVTNIGNYTYGMSFLPADSNGSVRSAVWSLTDTPTVTKVSENARNLVINVNYINPEAPSTIVIGATPTLYNNASFALTPLTVTLMLQQVILEQAVNAFVMGVMYEARLSASQWQMYNTEAFKVASLPATLKNVTTAFRFPEIRYFGALTSIDMSGSSGLQTDIDATLMSGLTSVNLSGVPRNITFPEGVQLTSLHLGKPTFVTIHGSPNLTAANTAVDDPSALNSVEITNNSNHAFGVLLKMIG